MKKVIVIVTILALAMVFALTACGGESTPAPPPQGGSENAPPPPPQNGGDENAPANGGGNDQTDGSLYHGKSFNLTQAEIEELKNGRSDVNDPFFAEFLTRFQSLVGVEITAEGIEELFDGYIHNHKHSTNRHTWILSNTPELDPNDSRFVVLYAHGVANKAQLVGAPSFRSQFFPDTSIVFGDYTQLNLLDNVGATPDHVYLATVDSLEEIYENVKAFAGGADGIVAEIYEGEISGYVWYNGKFSIKIVKVTYGYSATGTWSEWF